MNWTELIQDIINSGLTQKEVGDLVGCSQNTIHMLFKGETKNPSYATGEKLIQLRKNIDLKHKVADAS